MVFDQNLEGRIKETLGKESNTTNLRHSVNTQLYNSLLKADARDGTNQPIDLPADMKGLYWAEQNSKDTISELSAVIEAKEDQGGFGGYKKAVSGTLNELSKEGKNAYYALLAGDIAMNGAIGNDASKELKQFAALASRAKIVREYAETHDGKGFDLHLRENGIDPALLGAEPIEVAHYRAVGSPEGLSLLAQRAGASQFAGLQKYLAEKPGLMKEIEKLVQDKKLYGNAAMRVHQIYNTKQETGYREAVKKKAA
ncbi:MAG: hypothetical protein WC595_04925 [Candidatus Nanoarchaeia archaeon]